MPQLRPHHFLCPLRLGGSLPAVSLILAAALASGCVTTEPPPLAEPLEELSREVPEAPASLAPTLTPKLIPVARYGRYTLVELAPSAAQHDLLLQVINVAIPNTSHATVGDALRHVLRRTGYRLCAGTADDLQALPLPAAHYQLGPLMLHDALATLAGPAWDLHVDEAARRVCFTPVSRCGAVTDNDARVRTPGTTGKAPETPASTTLLDEVVP
ncbi:PilL N-terminal domain-containing protein [Billgrantia endophytica]|uniref:Pilus assembly protein PilL n=1 Tax=Billgrantia endophytica TaxID=2033802 RepID=A0A2N7UE67_9GAMM|nr:PilL N-terminal domain-containing protein [Halomonas endophytica]PMR78729.1 hypothetical protein C1H69_00185 [Halomonas endophytica]